jgi:hypothetical protein
MNTTLKPGGSPEWPGTLQSTEGLAEKKDAIGAPELEDRWALARNLHFSGTITRGF